MPTDSAQPDPNAETTGTSADPVVDAYGLSDEEILKQAKRRFKQALEAVKDDFEMAEDVQAFIAGDQWPSGIKGAREGAERPCLTLDHLNQYVRHVVNSGLMRRVDVRVLPLNDQGDDKVAGIIAGLIRQITQTQTAKVAYETGLRHECQVGFGYWRVKAMPSGDTHPADGTPLLEIGIRRIADPRMVLVDPFCEYPDARDAKYGFVLTKLAKEDYKEQYNIPEDDPEPISSWQMLDGNEVLPWIGSDGGAVVVAEYYYKMKDGTLCWAILSPTKVLAKGIHHGNLLPIIRCVGEEYEADGKARKRGMVEPAMDAQRAYNYSSSAFIENAALAPIAPFVAAAGQVEQYMVEWKDAHRVPRAVLRYDPVSTGGQPVPPPQRSEPAGIPQGWQGMMMNLINDTQMIMGLAQPSVLGTGGSPVQSGAGIAAQQAPGEINTYHFHEHWFQAIEQTGRVILAMIPEVYTLPQAVKIAGDDGVIETALLNPGQDGAVEELKDAYGKVFNTSYNPNLGKYDVAISLGPSSATKKQESNKMLMTVVNANPGLMDIAGDLLFQTMDIPGADLIAKRLRERGQGPNPDEVKQMQAKMQQQDAQIQEMQQLLLAEQQKAIASLEQTKLNNETKLATAQLDAEVTMEIAVRDNINAILLEKIKSQSKIEVEIISALAKAATEPTHAGRMEGYGSVMEDLTVGESV